MTEGAGRDRQRTPTIVECFDELCPLVQAHRRTGRALTDHMAKIRSYGHNGPLLREWADALCAYEETGDRAKIDKLLRDAADAAMYARVIGSGVVDARSKMNERERADVVHVDCGEALGSPESGRGDSAVHQEVPPAAEKATAPAPLSNGMDLTPPPEIRRNAAI